MPNVGRKKGKKKKFAGRNNGPSRQHYWSRNTLERHKVKELMQHNGMSREEAVAHWRESRTGRKKV